MTNEYWRPKPIQPTPPDKNEIAKTLRWALRVTVIGFVVYGFFAYAFADIDLIPEWLQKAFVLIGGGLIVTGSEANTIPTLVAALSKIGTGRFNWMDVLAFFASLVGSLFAVLITFSSRQVLLDGTRWRAWSMSIGPLILGVASTLDFYGATTELALVKRDYEQALEEWITKMTAWRAEEVVWNEEHGITLPVDRSQWREAALSDIRRISAGMNGERHGVTTENLQDYLDAERLRLPDRSDSTIDKWVRLMRDGGQ